MSTLTPFGVEIRKLRLEKETRLLDLAREMGVTSAFLSAVETGRKSIPADHVDAVARAMGLSHLETIRLQRAADRTRRDVQVGGLKADQRELVAAFARKLDEMPDDLVARIKRQVFKTTEEETPFERKRRGILVPPMSAATLWNFADQIRGVFTEPDDFEFPIMDVLVFRLGSFVDDFFLDVGTRTEMGDEEGRVIAGENRIQLRCDVYEGAWRDNGRARFTACHELAHFLLHREVAFSRVRGDREPIYRDAEWQADTFAGSLMLARKHLPKLKTATQAAARCGMTPRAADVMWAKYRKEGLV